MADLRALSGRLAALVRDSGKACSVEEAAEMLGAARNDVADVSNVLVAVGALEEDPEAGAVSWAGAVRPGAAAAADGEPVLRTVAAQVAARFAEVGEIQLDVLLSEFNSHRKQVYAVVGVLQGVGAVMKRGMRLEWLGELSALPPPGEGDVELAEIHEDDEQPLLPPPPGPAPGPADEIGQPASGLCAALGARRVVGRTYVFGLSRQGRPVGVGPHWPGLLFTNALVVFATAEFIQRTAMHYPAGYTALALALCVATLTFLNLCGWTDPGVVLRGAAPGLRSRYCDECRMYTPPGAEHCDDCAVCVADNDHHCPWMGRCVGAGNMRWFVAFNATWVLYLIFVLGLWFHSVFVLRVNRIRH